MGFLVGTCPGTGIALCIRMRMTFLQKIVLTIVAGFCAACLVSFYRNMVEKADYELNQSWRNSSGHSTTHR